MVKAEKCGVKHVYLVMSSYSNLWGRKFGDSVVALSLPAGVLMIPARIQLEKAWAISTHDQNTHLIVAHKRAVTLQPSVGSACFFIFGDLGELKVMGTQVGDGRFTMIITKHKRKYGRETWLYKALPASIYCSVLSGLSCRSTCCAVPRMHRRHHQPVPHFPG